MSNMKCPFCKKELKLIGKKSDSGYPIDEYFCGCPQTAFHFGNRPMWNELRVLHEKLEEKREYCKRAEQELICTRKALEQSEICCTEWEKEALDYKAENIALSGELERTRKALDVATGFIKGISQTVINDCDNQYVVLGNFKKFAQDALNQIKTALEQKE